MGMSQKIHSQNTGTSRNTSLTQMLKSQKTGMMISMENGSPLWLTTQNTKGNGSRSKLTTLRTKESGSIQRSTTLTTKLTISCTCTLTSALLVLMCGKLSLEPSSTTSSYVTTSKRARNSLRIHGE